MKYIKYHSFWIWLNAWIFLVDELCVICTGPYVWNPMLGFKFLAFIAKKEINERIKERKLR